MVVMSHSTDIADGGEREVEDYEFFRLFSMDSYAMAIDVRMCCNFQKSARERLVGSTGPHLMQPLRTAC